MQYALLIYTPEPTEEPSPEAIAAEMEGYNAFTEHLRDRGAMHGGEALDSTATATTVRVVDGKTITTDGPFAETKETLGGFYLVEAADLDEAIAYAAMIPGARHGCIEVRPVWDYGAAARRGAGRGHGRELTPEAPSRSSASTGPSATGAPGLHSAALDAWSDAAHDVVDRLFREEQGRAVATLIRVTGDFDLAEEAVQDAFISALETWPQRGIPDNPGRVDHDHRPQSRHRPTASPQAPGREDRDAGPRGGTRDRTCAPSRPSRQRTPCTSPMIDSA